MRTLRCGKHLEIVPSASDLFDKPGMLEQVAQLVRMREWFVS